jgi:tetratricopeptide (TPR) repeat protein
MLLSICILMKDDADCLRRIAAMVQNLADEIVVICNEPVAESLQVAAGECGVRLVSHHWQNDFAAARNAGLRAARGEWVFWIDSDETLKPPSVAGLRELLKPEDILGYYVTIEDQTDAATMSPRQHPSLYRRREEIRYSGRIHEHFEPSLESLARSWNMNVALSPIRLQHTGYRLAARPAKLQRNIALLELELANRPGQLYYQIELGRSLLLAGNARGHAVLAEAAETLHPALSQPFPPNPLVAALLEYALSHAPPDFLPARSTAVELAARWFPASPPLTWRAARWCYQQGKIADAAALLERVVQMGETQCYDNALSFDQCIFGDETRLNLGVCQAKLGQVGQAIEQWKRIKSDSPFFALAGKNLKQLGCKPMPSSACR